MQDIKPTSKKRNLEAIEIRQLKDAFLRQLQSDHSVHIHLSHPKQLLIVESLWPSAISLTFSAIDDLFKDTVRVHKEVPVSVAQLHFLREKRTSELDNDALQVSMKYPEARILKNKEANDVVYINVSGLRRCVQSAAESINEMLNGFDYKEEVLLVDSKYQWTREWREATKVAIETECDVIVELPTNVSPLTVMSAEDYAVAICFSYVHVNELQQARDIVCECTTLSVHKIEVDSAWQVELLKAVKSRSLNCKGTLTSIQFYKGKGVVHIISPLRFPNGVEEMEERLMQYIKKEVFTSAKLDLEHPLSVLIQNRHMTDLKEVKGVFFKLSPDAATITISGKAADVETAKVRLKMLLTQLKTSMCTQSVAVPNWLQFAITTKEVRSVLNRYEKTHCVHITVTKDFGPQNQLKWEAKIHPKGWKKACTLQLVRGSLTKERTDAIVYDAKENLDLMGGLANSILIAGGSVIQEECTKYIDMHGPVHVGHAVCLGGGNLPCRNVIHAVGPRQGGKSGEDQELITTYLRSLDVAVQNEIESIAFSAIGTEVFLYPIETCASIAQTALMHFISTHPDTLSTVKFVLLREADVLPFQEAFQSLVSNHSFNTTAMQESSTSLKAGVKTVPVWMWEDDSGVYQCFTDNLGTQLEQHIAVQPSGSIQLTRDKWSYTMNLGAMTQTNNETGKVRKIRRDFLSLSSQWYWEDDSGQMQPYKPTESIAIEDIRKRQGAGNALSISGRKYLFDFDKQLQVNSTTGHRRRIEYRAVQQSATAATTNATASSDLVVPSVLKPVPLRAASSSVEIIVKGCRKDMKCAVSQIETHIKGMCESEVLQFPRKSAQQMERCLQDVCTRFHVHVNFSDVGSQTRAANLIGWKVFVSKVVEEGRKTLIELLQDGSAEEVSRPPEWELDDSPVSLKEVSPTSIEFSKVLSLMRLTLPNVRIIKLERIQNEWLWTRYSQNRKLIKKKNQGTAQELDLFHGTGSNPPHCIYTGEEGFDMRFSAQGMWGTGNYFAVNANYSHDYAYRIGRSYQMFLVKVLVGASYSCQSNPSLRMPPEKPSKTTALFGIERYDSVSGVTNGSKVYIIYDNLKAYPFYLITYTA